MSFDANAPLRAAVLTATVSCEPRPIDRFALRVPAIRRVMPQVEPPLDLDAPIYRYRIDSRGTVTVRRDAVGARVCSETDYRTEIENPPRPASRTIGGFRWMRPAGPRRP